MLGKTPQLLFISILTQVRVKDTPPTLSQSKRDNLISFQSHTGVTPTKKPQRLKNDEALLQMVPRDGFEPSTRGFSVHCSTD